MISPGVKRSMHKAFINAQLSLNIYNPQKCPKLDRWQISLGISRDLAIPAPMIDMMSELSLRYL